MDHWLPRSKMTRTIYIFIKHLPINFAIGLSRAKKIFSEKKEKKLKKKRFTIQTRIFWFDKIFSWMFCVHSFSFKAISTCFSLNLLAAARWFIIYLILIDLNGRENTKCKHNRSVDTHMHRICTCTCNSIRSTQRPNPTFIHFWIIRYVAHVQLWSPLNTCDSFYCYYFVLICAKICAEDKASCLHIRDCCYRRNFGMHYTD